MKKNIIFLSLLVLVLLFTQVGYAASNKTIQVTIDGIKVSVTEVPIIMDGQPIPTDFPSFVQVDRTLVPIRFIAEAYGAKVEWIQETQSVIVTLGDKKGELSINSNIAVINGEKQILDTNSIPKIATLGKLAPRTMVPFRFISEIFGYEVGWNNEYNAPYINSKKAEAVSAITNISVEKSSTDSSKIIISGDSPLEYESLYLANSNKLVVDISNKKLSLKGTLDKAGTIDVNDGTIETVQYSQFSNNPDITRVVLTLSQESQFNLYTTDEGKTLIISKGNRVEDIVQKKIDGKEAIVIKGTLPTTFKTMKLTSPNRLVIDIMDSVIDKSVSSDYNYELGAIKSIRVAQFKPDNNYDQKDQIVRVVLDIKQGMDSSDITIQTVGNDTIIYPNSVKFESISYEDEADNKLFTINDLSRTRYEVLEDKDSKTLKIVVPNSKNDLEQGIMSMRDGFINTVEVVKDSSDTTITIKFQTKFEYEILSEERSRNISLLLTKLEEEIIDPGNRPNGNKLIVIDAGHGGKDPGAIYNYNEKDLNLSIALKLNELLRSAGYDTIMTRSTDEFVELAERARIANDNNADLFISLHGNAHNDKSISGVQVLYAPANQVAIKESDQHPFAKAIMTGILNATGAVDKGIIQRPNLAVLNKTKMEAVLIEVGFMSNDAENKLINSDEYQNKVIKGILNAVDAYLLSKN